MCISRKFLFCFKGKINKIKHFRIRWTLYFKMGFQITFYFCFIFTMMMLKYSLNRTIISNTITYSFYIFIQLMAIIKLMFFINIQHEWIFYSWLDMNKFKRCWHIIIKKKTTIRFTNIHRLLFTEDVTTGFSVHKKS